MQTHIDMYDRSSLGIVRERYARGRLYFSVADNTIVQLRLSLRLDVYSYNFIFQLIGS